MQMKRVLLSILVSVCAVIACLIRPAADDDIELAKDVKSFAVAHRGNLPLDWAEFCEWMRVVQHSERWHPNALNAHYVIRCYNLTSADPNSHPVEIVRSSISPLLPQQEKFDRILRSALYEADGVTVPRIHD